MKYKPTSDSLVILSDFIEFAKITSWFNAINAKKQNLVPVTNLEQLNDKKSAWLHTLVKNYIVCLAPWEVNGHTNTNQNNSKTLTY